MGALTYIKLGAAVALVALLVGLGATVQGWRNDSKLLKPTQAQLVTVTAERDTLKAAVDLWQKAADKQQKRADAAEAKAQEVVIQWKTRVEYVSGPTPVPGDTCAERTELQWLLVQYEDLRLSWETP